MDDLSEAVAAYLRRAGINQAELAERADVSQASVSRALAGVGLRRGRARIKISNYIQEQDPAGRLPPTLTEALTATWDRTDAHARALVELLTASKGLWPGLSEQRNDDSE